MKFKAFVLGVVAILPFALPSYALAGQHAKWNVLFFLNGKNSLQHEMQEFVLKNLYAMSDVNGGQNIPLHLPQDVNILVEYGTIAQDCDPNSKVDHDLDLCKTGVKRFRMIKGLDQVAEPDSAFQELGKVDMGNVNSLVDFANWSRKFPADHTVLYVFNHGSNYTSAKQGLFSFDDETGHSMNAREIARGFQDMAGILGRPIDLFITDMCLVGSAEAIGQMTGSLRFYVASRESVSGYAVSVIDILRVLEHLPGIDAKRWAYQVVLQANHYTTPTNFSAFNMDAMPDFELSIAQMTDAILRLPPGQRMNVKTHILKECHFKEIEAANSWDFNDVLYCFFTMPGMVNWPEYKNLALAFSQVMFTTAQDSKDSGLSIWAGQYARATANRAAIAQYRTLLFDQGAHWSKLIQFLSEGRD